MFEKFKEVNFKATIWVNFLRAFFAGIAFIIIGLLMGNFNVSLLFAPLFLWVFPLIFIVIGEFLSFINMQGIANIAGLVFVLLGDPFMFVLHKIKPEWVPVQDYSFLVFNLLIQVTNEYQKEGNVQTEKAEEAECPYYGAVLADKDETFMGFNWPVKTKIFTINKDWSVDTKHKQNFGFIDEDGGIHEGIPLGGIDPKETMASKVIAKIQGDFCYNGNEKIGDLIRTI